MNQTIYKDVVFGEIKIGDRFRIMITGMTTNFEAKVIDFDENRGGRPILEVDGDWMTLKDGDYILRERL
jgi:hypothetical protein